MPQVILIWIAAAIIVAVGLSQTFRINSPSKYDE